ncbi:hypothetical protein J5N97_001506 [Dioscorea zingiberensis]|uniref:Uncharacterized protein n=1 Tax=Dioscorea zingiberensis TaxID=325984 RepID=A0A9D5H255_9LILI|nr:hypothetical protein J5N97_001506 [Dioscorea zingiberensis]
MVTGFKRYLSLPVTRAPKRRPLAEEKADHVRSTSLPCPSHPLISHLEDEIAALRAWHSRTGPYRLGWVRFGLDRLERVLSSLTELLRLPQAQGWVRRSRGSVWTERLLEDSVRLADGFGTLRLEIMAMSDHQWTARTAIRRRDEPRFAASARSMRRSKKDLVRVASALKSATRSPGTPRGSVTDAAEAELTWVVRQAVSETVVASESVVLGIATAVRFGTAAAAAKKREMGDREWRRSELERLERLGAWMEPLQSRCERVFRSVVNIRVLLLNTLTPCL